ncbi:MAG: SDR family oxidoreductase [Bacteroidota bacterium]|jgi:NAD(P)-dependent dehydrogenase (short-subunit alcohol dehydrogenase family)
MKNAAFDDLKGKVCVITGGGGIIGKSLSEGLAAAGVRMAVIDLVKELADGVALSLRKEFGVESIGVVGNVLEKESLQKARERVNKELGKVDFLINCAGGNSPKATTQVEFMDKETVGHLEQTFYGLDIDGFRKVFDLNFIGTILPTMVFSLDMVEKGSGAILNISSMNSFRPLTKIPAYSAAKASVNNFTEWLAAHLAKVNIRVNAIAPGFFLTNQNRFLLIDEKTGGLTARGNKILAATPLGKFGNPEDLQGAALYLLSDLSKFVTGVVLPIDGGFNAYSGV